jgi:S1-C subfamily serine protease
MPDDRPSRRQFLAGTGLALSAAMAGCSLDAPGSTEPEPEPETRFPDDPELPPQTEQLAASSTLTEVYQEVSKSVTGVRIGVEDSARSASGTAWVYDEDYLVTNNHVVRNGSDPYIWFTDAGWREAEIVGKDLNSDLAVLEVENKPETATPLTLVQQPVPVGTQVAAIGNPFGLTGSFTTGVVSGRNRTIDIPRTPFSIADGIQTDAALNPGNSGGPLITYDGRVVGVVSAGQGDNVGFAISAAMVKRVVPELIEDGEYEHTYLGVALSDVTPKILEANDMDGITWGVYINQVPDGSPSDGVLQGTQSTTTIGGTRVPVGGDVIIRMEDWAIQSRERLSAFLALETEPGDTIEIEVVRDGSREVVEVTVGARSEAEGF